MSEVPEVMVRSAVAGIRTGTGRRILLSGAGGLLLRALICRDSSHMTRDRGPFWRLLTQYCNATINNA